MRAGNVQTRYVPVGPVMVPLSVKPCASAMVGQPPAGVTVAGGGGGGGGGGGAAGLLMVMLPPVPGDAISSAPQPVTRAVPDMGKCNGPESNHHKAPPVDHAANRGEL